MEAKIKELETKLDNILTWFVETGHYSDAEKFFNKKEIMVKKFKCGTLYSYEKDELLTILIKEKYGRGDTVTDSAEQKPDTCE